MFDAGSGGSGVGTHDFGDDRTPERRQYTLKGVESDTVRLMRNAARKEGMKIGSWVSLRMREAAEKALRETTDSDNTNTLINSRLDIDSGTLEYMDSLFSKHRETTDQRFRLLERELHEITSGQRSILAFLVSQTTRDIDNEND